MTNFDPTAIPDELRERNQWVCWAEEERNGKLTKIPKRPDGSGRNAKSSDMATWSSFEDAANTAEREDWGLGFMFSDAGPYVGLDLDHCLNDAGAPKEWLPSIEEFLDETFIEKSPSGTGLHLLFRDERIPEWWTNQEDDTGGVELYDSGRFFTVTGDTINDSADIITDAGDLGGWLLEAWAVFNDELPRELQDSMRDGEESVGTGDLDVYDVLNRTQYPAGERVEHPVHGSKQTGANFSVDEGGETWRCWRDDCTGNALHLIGMDAGIIECGDWVSSSLDDATWREICDEARERGYDLPEPPDNAPISAGEAARSEDNDGYQHGSDSGLSLEERIYSEVLLPIDPPDEYEGETITQKVGVNRAAEIFDDEMSFVRPREQTRGWRDCLYVYVDGEQIGRASEVGIFEPNAKAELERMGERLFGALANDQFVREFVNKVERRNRVRARTLQPAEERIVVNNGVLDLTTGELDPHTSEEYHRTKVEHDYDPDAECPAIDQFFHEIVADEDVPTLYRFIAHALYKGYPEAKAAMLLGDGANGKSMFLSLVEEFLGEFNVSGRSLQDITEYRWAANDLVGKLANIHADMSDQDVESMRMFKNLTGEDTVDADVKFEKPVKFTNHATMLFACNDMPVLKDDTQGNWRRWVLINFPNTFDDDDPSAKDAKARDVLEAELFDEDELEGLLARCVEEIQAWQNGRAWFPDVPDWRATRSKMRRAAEPVFDFAEACLVNTDESSVEKADVREAYRQYATREGLPKMEREEFGRKLHMLADYNVEAGQKRADNGPGFIQIYKGVELNGRGESLIGGAGDEFDPREAVMQVVRGEDGRIPEALVIERLHDEYGIDNGRAEHALKKLKENGTLLLSKKHGIEWVEVT